MAIRSSSHFRVRVKPTKAAFKGKRKHLRVQLPRAVRNYQDYDYIEKLSTEELAWLKDFSNKYYRAQFDAGKDTASWNSEEKRKAYSRKNQANRDLFTRSVDWSTDYKGYFESDNMPDD